MVHEFSSELLRHYKDEWDNQKRVGDIVPDIIRIYDTKFDVPMVHETRWVHENGDYYCWYCGDYALYTVNKNGEFVPEVSDFCPSCGGHATNAKIIRKELNNAVP